MDLNLDISYLDDKHKICGIFPAELALQMAAFFVGLKYICYFWNYRKMST